MTDSVCTEARSLRPLLHMIINVLACCVCRYGCKHGRSEPARWVALKLIRHVMDVPLHFYRYPHKMVAIKQSLL
jgi:hypothetical protein